MYNLIIETSIDQGYIGLAQENHLLDSLHFNTRQEGGRQLLLYIDNLLKRHHICCKKLKFIGVGIGPGSFTGIRVGVATALGLTFFNSPPIITFCSLEALVNVDKGPFIAMLPARLRGSYVMKRTQFDDETIHDEPPYFVPYTTIKEELKDFRLLSFAPCPQVPELNLQIASPNLSYIAKILENKYANRAFSETPELVYL